MRNGKYRSKGTLFVLILLFSVSAGVRLIGSVTAVRAEQGEAGSLRGNQSKDSDSRQPATDKENINIDNILRTFQDREERISKQEVKIGARMKALKIVEKEAFQRLKELEKAETSLRETMALASRAAEDDLQRLTTMYETMKPKIASALFGEMAPEFAAGFLGRMKPEIAAQILAGLPPERAYSISAIIAGRNANVPTE